METETKPRGRAALIVLLSLLTAGMVACVTLTALAVVNGQESLRLIQENVAGSEEQTQEDDVRIAGSYMIRSTTHISDAYLSGDASQLTDKDKETLDMASKALDEIIKDGMSDYEKEKAVYEWMTQNLQQDRGLLTVIPRTQADCDNPYGVLKYHNAVCVGYATTFRLFMQMLDIPCKVVHNTERYHSWDLVQLDGEWYHTDIYSDSGSGNYSHFNMNDAILSRNGQSWDTDFYPSANSLKYNLAYQEAKDGIDVYEIPAKMREALDDEDTGMFSFRYGRDFTEHEAQLANNMLSQIQEMIWNTEAYQRMGINYYFCPVDDGYLLVVSIERPLDEQSEELTDEEREKASEAVQEAFQDVTEGGEPDGRDVSQIIGGADGPTTSVSVETAQEVAWG